MFYTLRRKNYLKGEIEKIDKMIWEAEIKEQAAREIILNRWEKFTGKIAKKL